LVLISRNQNKIHELVIFSRIFK